MTRGDRLRASEKNRTAASTATTSARSQRPMAASQESLSAYELKRLENIASNEAVLESLGLKRTTPVVQHVKRTRECHATAPTRHSSRLAGEVVDADFRIEDDTQGVVLLSNGERITTNRNFYHASNPPEVRNPEALGEQDQADLTHLLSVGHGAGTAASSSCSDHNEDAPSVTTARVCPAPVRHLCFQQSGGGGAPSSSGACVLAMADEAGHVALWAPSNGAVGATEDTASDRIFLFKPHEQAVVGLAWCGSTALHTAS